MVLALGTLFAGFAAMWGAYSAHRGVEAWKAEKTWETDHELALKLYRAFRQRRDYYHYIRSPHSDIPIVNDEAKDSQIRDATKRGNISEARWHVWSVLKNIEIRQAELIDEARLRWDIDFHESSADIRELEYELACGLDDLRSAESGLFDPDPNASKEIDSITSSYRDSEDRKGKYNECFRKIEERLKPKIVGKSSRGNQP